MTRATKNRPEQIAAELSKQVQGDVFEDIVHRAAYSTDASIYRIVPACVVAPRDQADVVAVVKYAAQEDLPVAARGGGTGLAGEALCSGILLDMTRYMNRIIEVQLDGTQVQCEPGVVLSELNAALARYGRTIGPDPSSANRAAVGGCLANNATGAHWLQYGYIGQYVERLEVVLSDGTLAEFTNQLDPAGVEDKRVGSLAAQCAELIQRNQMVIRGALPKIRRNRCGYNIWAVYREGKIDMARLMAGSEGTLAIFTKITLRSVPVPRARGLLQLEFDSLEKMAEAVPLIVRCGASACELMDRNLTNLARNALPAYRDILPSGAAAVLTVEHTGKDTQEVRGKIDQTDKALGDLPSGRRTVLDPGEQARIWKSRMDAGPLLYRKRSRKHPAEFIEDTSVDNRQLGRYLKGIAEIEKKYGFEMYLYGHAGDSELHMRPYLDLGSAADRQKMQAIANEVFSLVWSLGGSISGEHAVGLVRAPFVQRQYGQEYYSILCRVKEIFDPAGLLNPGKIINADQDVMTKNLRRSPKIQRERTKTNLLFRPDELALELEQCYGCGLCRATDAGRMCPVFRSLREELGSPRAKANLLHFWATGQLQDKQFESALFGRFLDLCVHCRTCLRECPSGVDIPGLMSFARAQYARRLGLTWGERLLSGNHFLEVMGSIFSPAANTLTKSRRLRGILERCFGIDRRRRIPQFARGSFIRAARRYLAARTPPAQPVDKVAYFVDTYANYNDHELGYAVLDVFGANEVEVTLPKQLPAPLPAIAYGDLDRARKHLAYSLKHLAEAVRAGYKVVCSEPSAALCLKEDLKRLVPGADAELVAENTFELTGYLLNLFKQGKLRQLQPEQKADLIRRYGTRREGAGGLAYHLPCHLWALGQDGASIELLEALCGLKVLDLGAGCCGLAGTYGLQKKNYELSEKIAEGLKAALDSAGTKIVLTECSACAMQIEHISTRAARHPIKVLAEAYRGIPAG